MKSPRIFSQTGWRRAGAINVSVTYICILVLLICFSLSISRKDSSILSTIIFEGPCATSSSINLFLHLLVNTISGAILASSNFFMQILSAPSREEIDQAHARLQSLDIGIPSFKNLWHMSWFKLISWLFFFFSSVPMHLFFNSTIYQTEYLGSEWHLTIATEAFTEGATFFPPGASLSLAGSSRPAGLSQIPLDVDDGGVRARQAYGDHVPLAEYWDTSSIVRRNITSVARKSHDWTVLNVKDCQAQYVSCKPRSTFGDVVIIVDSGAPQSAGWTRGELFDFQSPSNLSSYWDPRVPPEGINSLWFSTQCGTLRYPTGYGAHDSCFNSCLGALGSDLGLDDGFGSGAAPGYWFQPENTPPPQEPWFLTFFVAIRERNQPGLYQNRGFNIPVLDQNLRFNGKFDSLHVRYCLAKPNQGTCKVGVSNALLLVVIGCVFIKGLQATIVVWKLPSASLVTPGDAIQSFLAAPDSWTQGFCTLDIADSEQLEYEPFRPRAPDICILPSGATHARKWKKRKHRLASAITSSAWVRTYAILVPSLIMLIAGLGVSSVSAGNNYSYSFDHAGRLLVAQFSLTYFGALLLVNTPQLIFSSCYFLYNAIITRQFVEKEWNSFSSGFRPLRVSYPTGEQVSTYRLQLPYSYGIPMIAISISFHFFVSNAVYLLMFEGGYVNLDYFGSPELLPLFHLPNGSTIALGFSPFFFLLLLIASFIFIVCSPVVIGLQKLKYQMVAGGCNSLVISATCHASDLATNQQTTDEISGSLQRAPTNSTVNVEEGEIELLDRQTRAGNEAGQPLTLAQRKLRWGAMTLPRHLAEQMTMGDGREVFHLGFGVVEDGIREPDEDHYYA